jgi:hypothetical protein
MKRLLVINGWNIGLNKVLLTNTLRTDFGYSLSEAKAITDQVLNNQEIRIPFERTSMEADDLIERLREIGAKASISA